MKTINIAEAKSHFSALLADVEVGEEVVITRRGKPIARIVAEPPTASTAFDLSALRAYVESRPCLETMSAADMRQQDIL